MMSDYWENASEADWRAHVIQCIDMGLSLLGDSDFTVHEGMEVLSDAYLRLHRQRAEHGPEPTNEWELEDLFWGLQRTSAVIDSLVGSACVVLMRWMEHVKQVAIGNLLLVETRFPFELESEPPRKKWRRHERRLMETFGSEVPDTQVRGAYAVWQIGNVFKHSAGRRLHPPTEAVARKLGFSSLLLEIPQHEEEEVLRENALREVTYTLDADSIERMALHLGCGPTSGLMPLYDHVESWQKAIYEELAKERARLRAMN